MLAMSSVRVLESDNPSSGFDTTKYSKRVSTSVFILLLEREAEGVSLVVLDFKKKKKIGNLLLYCT